jgi:hypothetical protein
MRWRKRWSRRASLVTLGLAACSPAERAREALTIELEPVVALRESGDSLLLDDGASVIAGERGGYVVLRTTGQGALAFYDSAGRLTAIRGPTGRGPGEFQRISGAALGAGDSLYVGDTYGGTLSVFTPGDHRFVRATPTALSDLAFKGTPKGRLASPMATFSREKGQTQFGFRLIPWGDTIGAPIGSGIPFERFGPAGWAPNGHVWIADRLTYTLTLFDGMRSVRTVRRDVDWYPRDTSPVTAPAWVGKGRPFMADVSVGADGHLWVLLKRKNPRYRDTTRYTRPMSPMGFPPLDLIFESVLEVLDAETGELIDSRVLPGNMIRFIAPGRLYQKADADSAGALMLQIWDARLKPRG